jgi:hypothetical protein
MRQDLWDFDINLVGYDCSGEIDPYNWDAGKPWSCPFQPGCGAKNLNECAAAKQLARILPAPEKMQ